jgi:hypothetical protein
MNQNNFGQQQPQQTSFFMRSMEGLAKVVALIVTFLLTPPLWSSTVGWVSSYSETHYGVGTGGLASLIWGVLMAMLVYHTSKATIGTALVMGGLGIAMRMLV